MSYPLGSALVAEFDFLKSGVLADPSPLPTIILAYRGDGSTIVPPALTHTATGRFRATVFSASDTASISGEYAAIAATTDATMDFQASVATWSVGDDVITDLEAILAKVNLIGDGTLFSPVPVGAGGVTTLTRGSSYQAANGLSLIYTLSGYPALIVDDPAYWRAEKLNNGGILVITGTCIATDQMEFELANTDTAVLKEGHYSLSTDIAGSNVLKTPNDSLIILESV